MQETVKFASDVSELKKLFAAGGAAASIIKSLTKKENVFSAVLGKLPVLLACAEIKFPEVLPEMLDIQKDEAFELVEAFYNQFA